MTDQIRVAIAGYGNLGRGVEAALAQNPDMELFCVFSRRDPANVTLLDRKVPVYAMADVEQYQDEVDVMILCGGSKTDLPKQGPYLTQFFNTVDSFDTHAKVNEHFAALDDAAQMSGNIALLAVGRDPGLMSLNRLFGETILPEGKTDTGTQSKQIIECSLALGSNLEFTASALVAYSRAVYRLARSGEIGAKTVFDVAPGSLSPKSPSQLRKELL
ncbi:diaminopimelate dehydrogenase [Marinobacter sp. M3C]|jgi:diaminopimelate dehydrogenase|uniref:diaminopimelate dehydrogenase n=1 Tax=unclassified Marinobacter TaxID=83889 RepID=UPI00200BFA5F|nr:MULTISPECIES: diaminopimelate dehydrogenase [unclassified Marinobacter]MCL1478470.1 diaminopimelate dehydrogenase [Marinobacter sp.]MCL1485947.1 diaminopimelate dehydrogenase [Marinobacter sp.]UQG55977.1 diaminopimelate dehydrogenase [Marinobacter sp. M4C]UQG58604.1 diaminopimelate dehydrogenase [Marinobacter sp. M3C]UQG64782.1 diaminopimelate dehydrogenase [Marinobacter sp. M2C]